MSQSDIRFDFMAKRRFAAMVSISALVISIVFLTINGLNFGLDFTGGTEVEFEFAEEVSLEEVRSYIDTQGFDNALVQQFGSERDIRIRVPSSPDIEQAKLGDNLLEALRSAYPQVTLLQSNFVGPAVGQELANQGGLALLAAIIVVMIYILLRFTKQFSVGAVIALIHDVIIVLGIFAIFKWTFDLPVLAALLAVIGYSLNDTIVVSDRIRENFRRMRKGDSVTIINRSLNQTLGRTLVTSLTTLFVLVTLLVVGGEMIRGFALALTLGVVVGTYSSVYIAASVLLAMKITREDLLVPEKETSEGGSYP